MNARPVLTPGVHRPLLFLAIGITLGLTPGGRTRAQDTPQPPPKTTPDKPPVELVTQGVTFAPSARFDKGLSLRYATQSSYTLRIPGQNGGNSSFATSPNMVIVLRYRVRDTKPDSTAQVAVTSEGGRLLDASGAFQDIPKEPDTSAKLLTLDRQSHIVAFKDQTARGKAGGLDALFSQSNLLVPLHILPLPDKTIKVGEAWTARYVSPGKSLRSNAAAKDAEEDVSATLTLLGSEKIADTNTIKIKQVLTVPFVAYIDAQGKAVEARNAKSRMDVLLTFTQLLNALPETGLLVRSEGVITGTITFAGEILRQLPGDTMTISGKMIAVRVDDEPLPQANPAHK